MSEKKKTNLKIKLFVLYISSFIVSVAPLLICFVLNRSKYVKAPGDTVKLCIGGLLVLVFIFLKVVGKLKMPRRIVLFGIVFLMTYLLQAILHDLLLLSGMALIGEILDYMFFQRAIRITKENIVIGKTAETTAAQVEEVIKKYVGRV